MSKMVSARVPDAIYAQASIKLESLGVGVSDLVNAAFEYVLKEQRLPGEVSAVKSHKRRRLSKNQKDALTGIFRNCTLGVKIPDEVSYDKRVVQEARAAKHEDPA